MGEMEKKYTRDFTISSEAFRDGHVKLRRHYVGAVVKAESSLMAVDSLRDLSPISRPERPMHQVRALALREAGEPINSPMLSDPVSRLNVVGMSILREPRSLSLLSREETLLAFRHLVKPLGGFFAIFSHSTILQLI
jgi:hypothetical protein